MSDFAWLAAYSSYMRLGWRGAERSRAANFSGRARRLQKDGASGPSEPGIMANPFELLQQVRSEASKVVWPTRRETLITTGMVMLMVLFTSVFFLVVDEVLRVAVSLALGLGHGG
jgi:preprotein translocase subunit SecE